MRIGLYFDNLALNF